MTATIRPHTERCDMRLLIAELIVYSVLVVLLVCVFPISILGEALGEVKL